MLEHIVRVIMAATLAFAVPAAAASAVALPTAQVPVSGPNEYASTISTLLSSQQSMYDISLDLYAADDQFGPLWSTNYEYSCYSDPGQVNNDDIGMYEVYGMLLALGAEDPEYYYMFEVNPLNVTYTAWVSNPSGTEPAEITFITDPVAEGLITEVEYCSLSESYWQAFTIVPWGFFNLTQETAIGTQWRAQFYYKTTNASIYPTQYVEAWSPPPENNIHLTSYFGHLEVVESCAPCT